MAKYAFKDAVDFKLYPAGTDLSTGAPTTDPTGTIVIDYLNESSLSLSTSTEYARIKGVNAVPFSNRDENTFTVSAEVIPMEYLALLVGGTYDATNGKITVKGEPKSVGYVAVGTFRGKQHLDNTMHTFQIIMYNVSPQPNADLTLNATDIGSFELVFDLLVDEDENLIDIELIN